MLKEEIWELGKRAFHQSISLYTKKPLSEKVLIVGLDTEYYEEDNHNELVSWQLSKEKDGGEIYFSDLTAEAIVKNLLGLFLFESGVPGHYDDYFSYFLHYGRSSILPE